MRRKQELFAKFLGNFSTIFSHACRQRKAAPIDESPEKALQTVWGTLAGQSLLELPQADQDRLRELMTKQLESLRGCDGVTYGSLASTVLTATKP